MIPKFLSARILAMMNERQEYIRMLGDRWEGANWLFIQEDGKQMSYFTPNQTMTKIIDRYNTSHEDHLPHIGYEKQRQKVRKTPGFLLKPGILAELVT